MLIGLEYTTRLIMNQDGKSELIEEVTREVLNCYLNSAEEIAGKYSLTNFQLRTILGSPEVAKTVREVFRESYKTEFDLFVIPELFSMIRNTKNVTERLECIKTAAKLLGVEPEKMTASGKFQQNNFYGFDQIIRELTAAGPRAEEGEFEASWPGAKSITTSKTPQ